jgi:hypothetical protein
MSNPSFEQFKQHPKVKGVSLGMCVDHDGGKRARIAQVSDDGVEAHAHYDPTDKFFGWICVDSPTALGTAARVSNTLMHELAHLFAPLRTHDDRWRAHMRKLGQPITAKYQKRQRHVVID